MQKMRALLLSPLLFSFTAVQLRAAEGGEFKPGPDHEVHAGVPQGTVKAMGTWKSTLFPDTTREWWIYVPAQYKPDGSAALMVFQDGQNYINLQRTWRIPTVFDAALGAKLRVNRPELASCTLRRCVVA